MSRVHLFEWGDQPWLPRVFRDYITDHLRHGAEKAKLCRPVLARIADAMRQLGETRIVDLCSGAGGPLPSLLDDLQEELGAPATAILTDLYPNLSAVDWLEETCRGSVVYRTEPTSAFDVPEELTGFRTMFTALHHFRPSDARNILADAVAKQVGFGAFEAQERTLRSLLLVTLFVLSSSLLFTPIVGRLTFWRFLLTYIIPLAPMVFWWDGIVSCLRTYGPAELRELTKNLETDGYRWEAGRVEAQSRLGRYRVTYLIGLPAKSHPLPLA